MRSGKRIISVLAAVVLMMLPAGCDFMRITEDLSDCATLFSVKYNVTLRTNLTTQVQTVLRSRFENEVADLLEDSLKNIFREFAHDVDLSFYPGEERSFHDSHIMDAGQATYSLELPVNDYRHLALANLADEVEVDLTQSQWVQRSYLSQIVGDTIQGHNTGLFTARQDMNILGNVDQEFDVTLYMVNCASILVIRTDSVGYSQGVAYRDCQVYSSDFADGFMVNDSTFTHRTNPTVHDFRVTNPPVKREIYYAVTFPSCDTPEEAQTLPDTRADNSQTGSTEEDRIWRKYVYVTLPNGDVTRTIINVKMPLQAGQVMIIYAYMRPDGSIYSPNVEVSTSVSLKWKDGLDIETGE